MYVCFFSFSVVVQGAAPGHMFRIWFGFHDSYSKYKKFKCFSTCSKIE